MWSMVGEQRWQRRQTWAFAGMAMILALWWQCLADTRMLSKPGRLGYYNNGTHTFRPTVIVVSLDGFRNDYLDKDITSSISRLAEQGIRAEYMIPSFPSITFPNHWTLATGLYPESHGIVGNEFFDPVTESMFYHSNHTVSNQPHWWHGEPIWATCTKSEICKSAVIMWPGSAVRTMQPDYLIDYNRNMSATDKMDALLGWLDMDDMTQRPQLLMAYVEEVDIMGHAYGPDHEKVRDAIRSVDAAVGHLMQGLKERRLDQHVDVIILSDHGMAPTDPSRFITYDEIIPLAPHREVWPLLGLRPTAATAIAADIHTTFQALENYTRHHDPAHFKVYLREEMPARFHYRANNRIPPILVVPDTGYALVDSHSRTYSHVGDTLRGIHGYDNQAPEMRAIFVAYGPRVRNSQDASSLMMIPPFENVEVYRCLADLLHLLPAPNNGTHECPFARAWVP